MDCVVCKNTTAEIGVLCENCRDDLSIPRHLMPSQVSSTPSASGRPTKAALIDFWGRPHRLDARTLIGRHLDGAGISVLDGSISRHHAHVAFDAETTVWSLRDLGSANGTFYNEQPVRDAATLNRGDRFSVSQVGFYFIDDASDLPTVELDPGAIETIRPFDRLRAGDVVPGMGRSSSFDTTIPPTISSRNTVTNLRANVEPAVPQAFADGESEKTDTGLPLVNVVLQEPTGGGGGLFEVDGKQVQLTTTQYEFIVLLVRRMADEPHQPTLVRGFVRTSELIADLSWDTKAPGDNHVKQLVRRVRRALIKGEIGDLVESRHRFGYRLRAIPKRIDG